MTGVYSTSAMNMEVKTETAIRCSIILLAGSNFSRLNVYILCLSEMKLSEDYEIIVINDHEMEINEGLLRAFLPSLKVLSLGGFLRQEKLFNKAAMVASGKFLLFIKSFINFDKLVLEESINELETSGEKISVSANNNFVLAERFHYTSAGGFGELFGSVNSARKDAEFISSGKINYFRNLHNENIAFKCGPGTFIDPDVIIDSPTSVKIGSNCVIRKGVVLRPERGEIVIGDNCVINHYCVFHGKGGIYLGDWTIVAPHCGFYAQNHTYERFDIPITKHPNVGKGIYLMGDNWIGGHSVICDDVTIGKGAVIGANSTVTKSVPMASIAVGSPARVIKKRHSGGWDFHKVERAASEGMPRDIYEHVRKRGQLIQQLINGEDIILDLGCGEGIITAVLAEKCDRVIGCDYSTETVNIAKERHPDIEFMYSNSTNLTFNNESFTKVIISDVAEHLMPVQFIKTLAETNRVLRRCGGLILATPVTGRRKNTSTYAHIYEYSESEIREILDTWFYKVEFINKQFGIFIARKR